MGNKKKTRRVQSWPKRDFFQPKDVPFDEVKSTILSLEGFEALRLVDWEGVSRNNAAEMMGVSAPTLSRILSKARSAVAGSIANGWAIHIHGGAYTIIDGSK